MHPMRQLRQGDILVERLERAHDGQGSAPDAIGRMTVVVLAAGEATGHAHRLETSAGIGFLWHQGAGDPLLIGVAVLAAPAIVRHDEHAPLHLPAGIWRFSRQRRYDPSTQIRAAAD